MGSDRSLDEFTGGTRESSTAESVDADDDSKSDAGPGDDTTGAASATEALDSGESEEPALAVEPAESTYSWSPAGATCAACGASVERRWRDEGELVCADCKSW
jgi:hypothetical protein